MLMRVSMVWSLLLFLALAAASPLVSAESGTPPTGEKASGGYEMFESEYIPVFPQDPESARKAASSAENPNRQTMVNVSIYPVEIDSDLFIRRFTGYTVTITNKGPKPVTLAQSTIHQGVNGETAYEDVKRSIISPATFLGISAVVGNTVKRASNNSQAKAQAELFLNDIPEGTIEPGASISTRTLVPFGKIPYVEVHFKDNDSLKVQYEGFVAVRPVDASLL